MKFEGKEPCPSCPYRRDAKLEHWHRAEFQRLLHTEEDVLGTLYACHCTRKDPSVCVGWLLDQRRRGYPSIMLRLVLVQDDEALRWAEDASDGGHDLYDSVVEMCEANGVTR